MNPAENHAPAGRQLGLPKTAIFSVKKTRTRAVAHALDFDLVAVAATPELALQKLRSAVKHHIEFGFEHALSSDTIEKKAPQVYWDRIYTGIFTLGEDIEVDHQRIRTLTTRVADEIESCLTGAGKA
jgi:hypothetical protein